MINHIETIIQNNLSLGRPNSKGWHPILCKVCNDHGKKGPRAAFIFHDGGCSYNCFNCGISASYFPSDQEMSDKMVSIFRAFGIPDIDWQTVIFKNLGVEGQSKHTLPPNIIPTTIQLPECFYRLTDDKNDEWCQYSIEYLTHRQIDWTTYPFFCVKPSKFKNWYGRLIIPITYNDNIIFYQGRDLTDMHVKKYLNPPVARDNILYGYHNIQTKIDEPLFVTEGWFDAHLLNGIAIFGNKMTAQQIQWLNKTDRRKVIIPDRYGDGYLLAKQALQLGWSVSFLDINDQCKDINESCIKNGLLYTLRTIHDNICDGVQAQVLINSYCK